MSSAWYYCKGLVLEDVLQSIQHYNAKYQPNAAFLHVHPKDKDKLSGKVGIRVVADPYVIHNNILLTSAS